MDSYLPAQTEYKNRKIYLIMKLNLKWQGSENHVTFQLNRTNCSRTRDDEISIIVLYGNYIFPLGTRWICVCVCLTDILITDCITGTVL